MCDNKDGRLWTEAEVLQALIHRGIFTLFGEMIASVKVFKIDLYSGTFGALSSSKHPACFHTNIFPYFISELCQDTCICVLLPIFIHYLTCLCTEIMLWQCSQVFVFDTVITLSPPEFLSLSYIFWPKKSSVVWAAARLPDISSGCTSTWFSLQLCYKSLWAVWQFFMMLLGCVWLNILITTQLKRHETSTVDWIVFCRI